ncbi:MAG: hypothetical protein C0478_15540 [Planctomyces sp.]|nr:hypothetical protein [Planctomyces sp.]
MGYDEIQFVEMPKVDKEGLREVYLRLKPELEDAFGKPDAMSVLVYNADYDWRRYGFALQYNENWAEESLTGGFVSRQFLTMTNFFESSEKHAASAIQRNWRDATLVPCLNANCRQKKEADGTSRNLPVESQQDRLYLILPDRNFENYLYPKDGAHFYHLLKGKIEHYRCKGRKWELIP